ncbi:MAG: transaldolase, partial [Candidatus Thermofonsia Clade 3 bacterium]
TFVGPAWERLAAAGAHVQRPLWASTSTKNPAYPDLIYVEPLIGPHTVNTMPPQTLEAFKDHGKVALTVRDDLDGARNVFAELAELGVSMEEVTAELEVDGVKKFADSFVDLLAAIEERRKALAVI